MQASSLIPRIEVRQSICASILHHSRKECGCHTISTQFLREPREEWLQMRYQELQRKESLLSKQDVQDKQEWFYFANAGTSRRCNSDEGDGACLQARTGFPYPSGWRWRLQRLCGIPNQDSEEKGINLCL